MVKLTNTAGNKPWKQTGSAGPCATGPNLLLQPVALPRPPSLQHDLAFLTQPFIKPCLPCWTREAFPMGFEPFNLTLRVPFTVLEPLSQYS